MNKKKKTRVPRRPKAKKARQRMAYRAKRRQQNIRRTAEAIRKERRAILAATDQALIFRARLEAAGISSCKTVLDLAKSWNAMDSMSRNILLGWENGEGLPNV